MPVAILALRDYMIHRERHNQDVYECPFSLAEFFYGAEPMAKHDLEDIQDIKIAGCDVHLVYLQSGNDWTVVGTLASGTEGNRNKETITSGPWPSRDIAEQNSLEEITKLLGNNEDRHTSRVHNPGEQTDGEKTEQEPVR